MKTQSTFAPVDHEGVTTWAPDEAPPEWRPGDFVLTHQDRLFSKLIRFGQRLRIHGDDRKYTHWSHAALIVSEDGDLIEVQRPGVVRRNASVYKDVEYKVVRVKASDHDRRQAVEFAEWCLKNNAKIGRAIFFSIAVNMITGGKFSFFVDGTTVCSGLVARAQERAGAIFNRAPTHIMPADLAKYYGVA